MDQQCHHTSQYVPDTLDLLVCPTLILLLAAAAAVSAFFLHHLQGWSRLENAFLAPSVFCAAPTDMFSLLFYVLTHIGMRGEVLEILSVRVDSA